MTDFFATHEEVLNRAVQAIAERGYWSAYPESPSPKVYGETAAADGKAAFAAYLGGEFPLGQAGVGERVATEVSPFGVPLGIEYPRAEADALIAAATAALPAWRDAGPQVRAGVCLEILARLHRNVFELANAVHLTTGQPFVMAFQAGGPHALDRALEAVAYGYAEQTRQVGEVTWVKKADTLHKTYRIAPRGVALVIGCNTFPTWNSYPGFFASLVTGNPVIVKPHPRAIAPLAITVKIAREVLAEAGLDPNLVQLAPEAPGEGLAAVLAIRPEVKIIDYTGSTQFGEWLEASATQAQVYTEKAGVNTIIIDSTDDFAGMCRNIAFSLTLYSGQMCTTPQNLLIPAVGITTEAGPKSFDDVVTGIADAVRGLTADPAKAVEFTGAIVNPDVLTRLTSVTELGEVVLAAQPLAHPAYPDATCWSPTLIKSTTGYDEEWFGPITFAIPTDSTQNSLEVFRRTVGDRGAITAVVYSTDEQVLDAAELAALEVGVNISANLTGGVFVNQSAAFSDFHATGANRAANSALTDGAYVANRFRVITARRPA
ncbi:phenylacetic acid degradation protein paaN [Allocatelliglobosispora scoriae]|uniref:Phenylacetic acid degradation protein paaN n=2 Tax=Allocatelliglobosispora scoriae TaxID=643052 RepID=A0A841BR00_9ACTN|nr:phenylacetic acid degradation protein paaN [Allocatelliglobosispora scoriae]